MALVTTRPPHEKWDNSQGAADYLHLVGAGGKIVGGIDSSGAFQGVAFGFISSTYPPPTDNNTWLAYDSAHRTWYVERTDGQFSDALRIHNSSAPANTYFSMATDNGGQTALTSVDTGAVSAQLILNHSQIFTLCSAGGGGVTYSSVSGDTIIPSGICGSSPPATAMHISLTGAIDSYGGVATPFGGGFAGAIIYRNINAGPIALPFGTTQIVTTPTTYFNSSGNIMYHAQGMLEVTTASSGATCTPTITFTRGGNIRTASVTTAVPCGTLGQTVPYDINFVADVNTGVSIGIASTGTPSVLSSLIIDIIG